jgi:hypothetical protein
MGDSLAYIIEQRRKKCDAIDAALKLYPDAYIDGDYIASGQLKAEDCDYIQCDHTTTGDMLRVGRELDGIVVMMPFNGAIPTTLFWKLKRVEPELYQRLVQLVAK